MSFDSVTLAFAAGESSILQSPLVMFGVLAVIWIFMLVLPQRKEAKRRDTMQKGLKKGDRVLTQAGMIGKVHATKDETVVLEFEGAKIPFLRTTVLKLIDTPEGGTATK